jgi:glutamate synthase (NADPH/NADH) large chain
MPAELSIKDLPWQINWQKEKCTLCGKCTTVCPVRALELKRLCGENIGINQKTTTKNICVGCGMCTLVCPNNAIISTRNNGTNIFSFNQPRKRGGRRNVTDHILDKIKFTRISMLTDPALDAGRHEFELYTLLGRILAPEENLTRLANNEWIPPVRKIYPLIIGGMSFGALSPNMWEALQLAVAYLNEELNMPVCISTGEGGCPPRLLRRRFLKYTILQIASGYFGWDEIIRAIPEMQVDPCAIEIKYGQGAKPGDGGLLMWHKVNELIAAIRGVPEGIDLASPPTHQTKYSIEESVAKMITSMSMAWDFRVPVYPKISGTSTALAVLNNLVRNPYAAGLAIDGEDAATGAAYDVSLNNMGHPIASNIRDCYLNLVKLGKQNEIPLFAGGGVGKNGNLAANAAALIMLGASGVQVGKYIMQVAAGCVGSEADRCNICNLGICPKGITTSDPKLYRRLDVDKVAENIVNLFISFDIELKKILAPLGRSTSLPIGMADALGIDDYYAAQRLGIKYVV